MQPRGLIVSAGLPVHPGDRWISAVVIEASPEKLLYAVGVGTPEITVGAESPAAGVAHQPQRTTRLDRECAGCIHAGAQLIIVARQQPNLRPFTAVTLTAISDQRRRILILLLLVVRTSVHR